MDNNKKIIILLVFVISLLSFTTFFSFSRFSKRKVITDTIKTKELKIVFMTNGGDVAKSHSSIVKIYDTHSDVLVESKYIWALNNSADASNGTAFQDGDEISTNGLNGIYFLCVYALDDKGFYNNTCSNAFVFDNTAPTIAVTLDDDNTVYKKSHNAIIEVINDSYGADLDPDSLKYVWSKNIYVNPTESFASGDTVSKNDGTGNYYVIVKSCDVLGNCNEYLSNASKLDNDIPVADVKTEIINGERYAVIDSFDEHSGVYDVSSGDGITAETREKNLKIYVSTFNGMGSWGATDYTDYAQLLSDAGYTDVTVVNPADGTPTLEYLQNNGYNLLIANKAAWQTDQTLMNQLFAAGINLFTTADDTSSDLTIVKEYVSNTPLNSYGNMVGNGSIFANNVGTLNGTINAGSSSIKFIDNTDVFYTRVVNGVNYDVAGCYSNNDTKWFHYQEQLGMSENDPDTKLLPAAVDYIANKGLIYFKIPSDGTYTFNITDNAGNVLTKTYSALTYNVEYYQGNNSSTEGATSLPLSSQFTNGLTASLKTYSELGGTAPSGWVFAGWTTEQYGTNIEYLDGQSVKDLSLDGSTVKLYAVFMRTINVHSGLNKASNSATIQYYNPYKTDYYTDVNVPAPSTTNLSGWTAIGYRADTNAADKEYSVTTSATNIYLDPNSGNDIYAVYSRTITMYHGVNKASSATATQYYNTNHSVSSITAPAPSTTNLSGTGWSAIGYRADTNAADKTYAVTTSDASITPAYDSLSTLYAVYGRTITFYHGVNKASSSTATQYYNTNGNAVSAVSAPAPSTTNLSGTGWSARGYRADTSASDRTYAVTTAAANISPAYDVANTLYAVYNRTITFYHGVNKVSSGTATQYYNTNGNAVSAVSAPAPSTTNLSGTGWSARGYRADTSAADRSYAVTTAAANISPAYNVANTLYAVYSRTVTLYHGKNKASNSKPTQYYTSANAVSAISAPAPSTTNLSGQSWGARGYRADTSAADRSYAVTTAAANISPAYNVANTLYAVYSRTVTLKHNGNGNTGGSTANVTGTQYYTTNNSVSTVTLTTRANGFTRTGYNFSKWAVDSTSGSQITAGSNTTFAPGVDSTGLTKNVYAIWSAKSLTCAAGKYLPANSESCANCTAGSYCPGGTWTYNGSERGRAACAAGSYSGASASACTACQGSTSNAGSSSCNKSCGKSNVGSWNTASWNSSNNTVSNSCSIKTCASGYTLQSNNCNDVTAPSVPTTLQLYNPVLNSSTATYSLKVSGSSDVNAITYQVKINGSWQNCSNGVYNGSLANSSTSYTIEARACDSAGNCSGSASRKIWLNPKRLYVWQLYQYMRTTSGSTIMSQPTEDEVTTNSRYDKSASNANGMYNQTEPTNYFNSIGATQTVKNLYRGILGRDADSGGLSANVSAYNSNGRAAVIKSFVNSTEAQNIYSAWGIGTGTI